jgi:cytidylate kinase
MAVITLSRQLGSHGEEIAVAVAQALALRLIDATLINQAAQRAGVPEMALAELAREEGRGLANNVLKALQAMPSLSSPYAPYPEDATGSSPAVPPANDLGEAAAAASPGLSGLTIPFAGLFSPLAPPISASLEEYVRMVGLVIRGLAREGNVLILGRGGQVLLRKHPEALHVQIVAPFEERVQVVIDRQGLSQRAAQNRVRTSDRSRFDYLRRYHDADWLDPTLYHLVINTGGVSVATAVDLIVTAHQAQVHPREETSSDE